MPSCENTSIFYIFFDQFVSSLSSFSSRLVPLPLSIFSTCYRPLFATDAISAGITNNPHLSLIRIYRSSKAVPSVSTGPHPEPAGREEVWEAEAEEVRTYAVTFETHPFLIVYDESYRGALPLYCDIYGVHSDLRFIRTYIVHYQSHLFI